MLRRVVLWQEPSLNWDAAVPPVMRVTRKGINRHVQNASLQEYHLKGDFRGCTMVSKCASPACSEQFRYLHEGKLFHLTPTPEMEASQNGFNPVLYEWFWLCEECSQKMTIVWGGTEAKVVPLRAKDVAPIGVHWAKAVPSGAHRRPAAHIGVEGD